MSRGRAALWIAATCAVLRLAFFVASRPWSPEVVERAILRGDAVNYHALATTLLHDGRFAESATGPPVTFRTPLYPLLLAGVYAVAGERPWVALLVQIALEAATVLLLYAALRRMFAEPAARIGAWFYAADPFLLFYSCMLLTDTLFVFLLTATLYLVARSVREESRGAILALLAGLALGAATLARPPSQFLPLLIAPFLIHRLRARPSRALATTALFLLGFGLALAPWLWRNQRVVGRPVISTAGAYQLLILHASPLVAERRDLPSAVAERALLDEAEAAMRAAGHSPAALGELGRAPYYSRVAWSHIAADPWGFVRVTARGVTTGLLNLNTTGFALLLGQPPGWFDMMAHRDPLALARSFLAGKSGFQIGLAVAIGLLIVAFYALTLIGAVARLRAPGRDEALLLVVTALYFVVIGGAGSGVRYRLPAMPFALGFTGTGGVVLLEAWRSRRRRARAGGTAASAAPVAER